MSLARILRGTKRRQILQDRNANIDIYVDVRERERQLREAKACSGSPAYECWCAQERRGCDLFVNRLAP